MDCYQPGSDDTSTYSWTEEQASIVDCNIKQTEKGLLKIVCSNGMRINGHRPFENVDTLFLYHLVSRLTMAHNVKANELPFLCPKLPDKKLFNLMENTSKYAKENGCKFEMIDGKQDIIISITFNFKFK